MSVRFSPYRGAILWRRCSGSSNSRCAVVSGVCSCATRTSTSGSLIASLSRWRPQAMSTTPSLRGARSLCEGLEVAWAAIASVHRLQHLWLADAEKPDVSLLALTDGPPKSNLPGPPTLTHPIESVKWGRFDLATSPEPIDAEEHAPRGAPRQDSLDLSLSMPTSEIWSWYLPPS